MNNDNFILSQNKKGKSFWREGNSLTKKNLQNIGFKKTERRYIKEWLSKRVVASINIESDTFPIKICYNGKVGAFKTWADACYQVALIEIEKGEKI